jgi:hypothetical protein
MGQAAEAEMFIGAVPVFASATVAATPFPAETSVVFRVNESSSPLAGDFALVEVVNDETVCVLEV